MTQRHGSNGKTAVRPPETVGEKGLVEAQRARATDSLSLLSRRADDEGDCGGGWCSAIANIPDPPGVDEEASSIACSPARAPDHGERVDRINPERGLDDRNRGTNEDIGTGWSNEGC